MFCFRDKHIFDAPLGKVKKGSLCQCQDTRTKETIITDKNWLMMYVEDLEKVT